MELHDLPTFRRQPAGRHSQEGQPLPAQELVETARRVLLQTPAGQSYLAWLLRSLGWFDGEITSVEDVVEHNVASRILWSLGLLHVENGLEILAALQQAQPIMEVMDEIRRAE